MGVKHFFALLAALLATTGFFLLLAPVADVFAQSEGPPGVIASGDPAVPPQEDAMETARGLGMGSGARAGAMGVSALAYNPANLGVGEFYYVEAISTVIPGDDTTWTLGSAIVDSVTSKLAVGTNYRGVFGGEDREYKGWDWRTAIGIAASKAFGLGAAVRWAKIKSRTDEDDQRLGPTLNSVTMDAAIRITPISWLNLAGLGYNLIRTHSPLAPQMTGGSVSLAPMESFSLGGDMLWDLTTFDDPKIIAGGGVEYLAAGQVPIRAGYRRDQGRNLNQITASTGYASAKFAAEMSLRQTLGSEKETYLLFMMRYAVK